MKTKPGRQHTQAGTTIPLTTPREQQETNSTTILHTLHIQNIRLRAAGSAIDIATLGAGSAVEIAMLHVTHKPYIAMRVATHT